MSKADAPDLAGQGPAVDRRTFLKTVGAGAGAATVGTGAIDSPLTATQDADAAVVSLGMLAAGTALVGIGAIAGVKLQRWRSGDADINEDDLSDDKETQIYEVATIINEGYKGNFNDIANYEYGDSNSGASTGFEDAAWSEIRTMAARGIDEGWTKAKTKRRAGQMVDKQATRFVLNHIQLWNRRVEAFAPYMATDIQDTNDDCVKYRDDNSNDSWIRDESLDPSTSGWEPYEVDGTLVGMKSTNKLDLPWDHTKFDKWGDDEDIEILTAWDIGPGIPTRFRQDDLDSMPTSYGGFSISTTHSEYSRTQVFHSLGPTNEYLNSVSQTYREITDDLSNYIDNVFAAVAQGDVTGLDLLSPRDLTQQFAGADEMSRTTAELAAVGLHSPAEAGGVMAKVSGYSLSADSLWGRLFIRFREGSQKTVQPGTSITGNDYQIAYLLYQNQATGEPEAHTFTGNFEILDVSGEGVDQGENVDNNVEDDSDIPIWNPDTDGEPPEWIKNPPADKTIVVETPDGTYQFDPGKIQQGDDGTYRIPSNIDPGTNIKRVRSVGQLEYFQPIGRVKDPNNVDSERLTERFRNITRFRDKVDEEVVSGGGGVGGDWINQIISFFGGIKNAVVAAVVVVVGASAIGALNG
jgi:hypothetical protein